VIWLGPVHTMGMRGRKGRLCTKSGSSSPFLPLDDIAVVDACSMVYPCSGWETEELDSQWFAASSVCPEGRSTLDPP